MNHGRCHKEQGHSLLEVEADFRGNLRLFLLVTDSKSTLAVVTCAEGVVSLWTLGSIPNGNAEKA